MISKPQEGFEFGQRRKRFDPLVPIPSHGDRYISISVRYAQGAQAKHDWQVPSGHPCARAANAVVRDLQSTNNTTLSQMMQLRGAAVSTRIWGLRHERDHAHAHAPERIQSSTAPQRHAVRRAWEIVEALRKQRCGDIAPAERSSCSSLCTS